MTRSGYGPCDEDEADEWHRRLKDTIASPEGQAFLRELADALDALPEKVLIDGVLIDEEGNCCAIGAVCKARGIDVGAIDIGSASSVGEAVGISCQLAAEIEYENDCWPDEAPKAKWARMRRWVDKKIRKDGGK